MNELKGRCNPPTVDTFVIDDEVLVQPLHPQKIHAEHCDNEITGKFKTSPAAVKRFDLVFDI